MTHSIQSPTPTKGPLDAAQKIVAELEGMTNDQKALALKFATETLGLQASAPHTYAVQPLHSPNVTPTATVIPGQCVDIKTFATNKSPKSDQQFAAVVAYFYQFEAPASQRKDSVDAATMKDAARQAGRRQVKNWNVTLDNARRSGYLDKAERGAFKLNSVGENLVAITLPGNATPGNGGGSVRNSVRKKKSTSKATSKKG